MVEEKNAEKATGSRRLLYVQKRFLTGTAVLLMLFCTVGAVLIYVQERLFLEENAYKKSEILMRAVEANMEYVKEVLRPKMYSLMGEHAFVLEAMSTSFVSRSVMDLFSTHLPEYVYRRVAINARNPQSEADAMERRMIEFFTRPDAPHEWKGLVKRDSTSYYFRFRPVILEPECLHCHGQPEDAPQDLVRLYGSQRGFGRKPGEVVGLVGIGIPVNAALSNIRDIVTSIFLIGFMIMGVLYLTLSLFFNKVVVHNLKDLLAIFERGLVGLQVPVLSRSKASWGSDEIEDLCRSAELMVQHLNEARRRLEIHSEKLEAMVAERTRALERSQEKLRAQIIQRNRELHTLTEIAELTTQAQRIQDILPQVLARTLALVPAHGGAIYLINENSNRLELQIAHNADDAQPEWLFDGSRCPVVLEEDHADLAGTLHEAACGQVSFYEAKDGMGHLHIPLCCRGRVLGVMSFHGVDVNSMRPEMQELLFSIGRQIGVALESLTNLEKLLESKELLQTVFNGITDLLILVDRESRILMVNKAYLQRFGINLQEVMGRLCTEVHADSQCPFGDCSLTDVLRTGKPTTQEVVGARGEVYLLYLYPVTDESGRVTGAILYGKDVTQQKRVEQKIQQTERLVALGQLSAGLAHELNNPLGVILCYTDLLKREMADFPLGLKDVAVIEKHALNCKRIVSDLLKFARGHGGGRPQLASLNTVVEEALQITGHQFRKKGIQLECHLDETLPEVLLDVERMQQVLVNLLMNAIQALNGRGLVRVTTRRHSDTLEVRVWDNGPGIDPSIRDKIFDPFFTTKDPGEGSGLGLAVSYGIVQDHGGEIFVESEPGQWTEFIIRLPMERTT
ncbi:c-type heme family protein [Desulfosoma caldarium]|uniref:histidine kinase n=1 Tax=Desulfosoma caldarium TaxID=610254 RepID=A0A3N1UNZ3_9BACT|nr:DUF3365 domain-containing protein [Desulfosoma caldarium]ROQ90217.1 PAS domain S-box-containing protein [Desulfosoma caldarium]